MSVRDRESSTTLWLVIFVLLSLIVHTVIFLTILLVSLYMPEPKIASTPQPSPEVTLSLLPPPPPPQSPKHPIFLSTNPDATAKPNQNTPIESDNNSALKSKNQTARVHDSVLPDVTADKHKNLDLQTTPYVPPSPKSPAIATTQPTPKQSQPQPQQQMQAQQPQPQPAQPTTSPQPQPAPPKPPAPQVAKEDFNPNGLPVLPPIVAATLAPQTPDSTSRQVQNQTAARPPPNFQLNKSDISGSQGALGDNSVAANATELGRYKARFYRAVGSRWYAKVNQQFQLLPVGTVRIQYTIHANGIVDNIKVLDGNTSMLGILLAISQNSITEASPFDPFTPGMVKELIKKEGGDGSSYTDDFTFSVYGG